MLNELPALLGDPAPPPGPPDQSPGPLPSLPRLSTIFAPFEIVIVTDVEFIIIEY